MAETFIGQIMPAGFNFAPMGFALCNGQILPISQYTALFSLLGTNYGGNGTTNFMLPDLQGRTPLSWGGGQGIDPIDIGTSIGTETVTLITAEMAAHSHLVNADKGGSGAQNPIGNIPSTDTSGSGITSYATTTNTTMSVQMIQPTGNSQPHNNLQPTLTINYCIALEGVFPQRQ
ncbi:MAG: phage tail protein [Ignavibacteriae bacterium]|nr:phage tail protein [Ignavibacteriota bacterium]